MTLFEAVQAEVDPYSVQSSAIEKAMIDEGLTSGDPYTIDSKLSVAKVAVKILRSCLSLSGESEGGFSQNYDRQGLLSRIASIESENSLSPTTGARIKNRSNAW